MNSMATSCTDTEMDISYDESDLPKFKFVTESLPAGTGKGLNGSLSIPIQSSPTGREGEEAQLFSNEGHELSIRKQSALPSFGFSYLSLWFYVVNVVLLFIVQGNVKVHVQSILHSGHRLHRCGLHHPLLITLIAVDGSPTPDCHIGKVPLNIFSSAALSLVKFRKARL